MHVYSCVHCYGHCLDVYRNLCVLSSQLNRLLLEVILPEYKQTQFVYVLF